jgi:hypothetical protein
VRKPEKLSDGLVEDAKRMREIDVPIDSPTPQAALAKSPNPSIERMTAFSNGETRKADDKCAAWCF